MSEDRAGAEHKEEASEYVAEIMAAGQEESGPAEPKRPSGHPAIRLTAILLLIVAAALTLWNLGVGRSATWDPSVRLAPNGATYLIEVTLVAVERYRRAEGRLPADLAEIDMGEVGVGYALNDGEYILTAPSDTGLVVFRSEYLRSTSNP